MTTLELFEILLEEKPSTKLRKRKEELFELVPELKKCDSFNQHSKWHQYDVLEHILHVVDNVDNDLVLRVAALFHDIDKPEVFVMDEYGEGHFPNHWTKSALVFNEFASKNKLDRELVTTVSKLIVFHDLNLGKLNEEEINALVSAFTEEEINMLFDFKKADLLAQKEEYHGLLNDYQKQKENILSKYERSNNNEHYI